ncbi:MULTISPECIES: hypothetical protein [unclassified Pseudomonas]|jgi:flagellar biogenesis protein FliO|nr:MULTISPECIES: hypothetical protein [unclassified Pseudomonas]MCR8931952.1 hypothetical protein [Pseudomonas sp. S11A4]MCR8975561.1 hypothetical protein [Pseudomonas sp. S11P7]
MIAFLENNLLHFYFGFLLVLFGACFWGVRRLMRRARMVRGERV